MNHYPFWKYGLLLLALVLGVIYAAPNLYGEDPAVQISHRVNLVDDAELDNVRSLLQSEGVSFRSIELSTASILVRFDNAEQQIAAASQIREILQQRDKRYGVALNLAPATPEWLQSMNALPMYLGLDLRGGVHFLMEVDMDAAISKSFERMGTEVRTFLRKEKIRYQTVQHDAEGLHVRFAKAEIRDQARLLLEEEFRHLLFENREQGTSSFLDMKYTEQSLQEEKRAALEQNISTLRNRVNELGVAEPVIQRQGDERVVVQLPGVQDTVRAKQILGATATLEFRLTHGTQTDWNAAASGRVPVNARLYKEANGNPVLLNRRVIVTGDQIVGAASGIDTESGTPQVNVTLNGQGASRMADVTRDNIGKPMAVVFIEDRYSERSVNGEIKRIRSTDETVINIATIQDQLSKVFRITGLDSTREARDLALLLRAGSLRAPMLIIEERTIGPSLGQENIDKGFASVMVGMALVLIFMAVYYRLFGLIADVALVVNLVLIVAILSMLQATLTLPGIAGIVLTVGMAVDANVLIFERIREEIRAGSSMQAAISAGYEKALGTIADANITTLIAAIILFGFGTGPIKGFAITLSIGILTSMFTAIMGTRALVNLAYGGKRVSNLAI